MSFSNDNDSQKSFSSDQLIDSVFYNQQLKVFTKFVLRNAGSALDAEDVFHDALVVTYQKIQENSLELSCSLSTYVNAVGRNIWMNTLRKRGWITFQDEPLEIPESLNQSIIESLHSSERQLLFQKHFMKLNIDCQNILTYFFSGKSMAQISKIMKYSYGYSRKKKFECKKRLIEMIESDIRFKELYTNNGKENL